MPTLTLSVGPQLSKYVAASNGRDVLVVGNIVGRLIPQEGMQFGKDDFNLDMVSIPFKVFNGYDWRKLMPARGTSLSSAPDMVVWDPIFTVRVGKVMTDVVVMCKGLIARNGVSNKYNGFALNPKPRDTVGIASAQISGTDGSSVMDITFSRPQTLYRYVTTTDIVDAPSVINNAAQRIPRILSYSIRGSSAPAESGDDDTSGAATYVGYNIGVRERCINIDTNQVGNFFTNEATVVYEFYDTANPS